jgi:hypothetical protein
VHHEYFVFFIGDSFANVHIYWDVCKKYFHFVSDMKAERYALEVGKSGMIFEFVSEGPRGMIEKLVIFSTMDFPDIYNLAFGDKHPISGELDDFCRSNNGDADKVLATVVQTVVVFTELFPHAVIYAEGSSAARTRLYQMGIAKYLDEIKAEFEIFGLVNEHWEPFQVGQTYTAFLTRRKSEKKICESC